MADTKISALTAVTTPAGTDEFAVNQSGTSYKETRAQIHTADVHASYSEYTDLRGAEPAAPTGAAVREYACSLAGRVLPRFVGPSNFASSVQPALFANNVAAWLTSGGTNSGISYGVAWLQDTAAQQSHPAITSTNFFTQIKRTVFTTTTTAANLEGIHSGNPICWRGNAAGLGGFFFAARWGIATYTSTMRAHCGLSSASGTSGGDPSAINDSCLMSKDTGETVWQCMTRDTSTAAKISTGRTTAAAGTAEVFDFYMFCKPNDTQITFRVIDITDGTVLVDDVAQASHLPTNTAMLYAHCECQNVAGGAGSAVATFLNKIYIETDY